MKFRQMVWSQIKIRFEVIPDDSIVLSRLMSGTIVQTVKVWMQRMMKIGRSVGFAMRNAKYLGVLGSILFEQREIKGSQYKDLYVRIEPDVKEQAESILSALGIPTSNAINMFYKQIILNRGLPFEVKIPTAKPVNAAELTEAELNAELEKGYADMVAGRTKPARQAFADIRKDYGI